DGDDYVLDGPETAIWEPRLGPEAVRQALRRVIPSVGRIEVENHPFGLAWVGTGWLVDDDIIVSNRHVAEEFATRSGATFIFRRGRPNPQPQRMTARIDFKEEKPGEDPDRQFAILDILHIEDEDGPDMAFFKVAAQTSAGRRLASPLSLATQA